MSGRNSHLPNSPPSIGLKIDNHKLTTNVIIPVTRVNSVHNTINRVISSAKALDYAKTNNNNTSPKAIKENIRESLKTTTNNNTLSPLDPSPATPPADVTSLDSPTTPIKSSMSPDASLVTLTDNPLPTPPADFPSTIVPPPQSPKIPTLLETGKGSSSTPDEYKTFLSENVIENKFKRESDSPHFVRSRSPNRIGCSELQKDFTSENNNLECQVSSQTSFENLKPSCTSVESSSIETLKEQSLKKDDEDTSDEVLCLTETIPKDFNKKRQKTKNSTNKSQTISALELKKKTSSGEVASAEVCPVKVSSANNVGEKCESRAVLKGDETIGLSASYSISSSSDACRTVSSSTASSPPISAGKISFKRRKALFSSLSASSCLNS